MIGHFTCVLQNARELCQLDHQGQIVSRDKQTKFCLEVPVRCVSHDHLIDFGFLLGFDIELSCVDKLEERQRLSAVACAGVNETIPRFAKYGPWKLYDFISMPLSDSRRIAPAVDIHELKLDEELAPAVAEEFRKVTEKHRDTAAAFERAKKFLESNLQWLRESPSQAKSAAHFLADCMRSDGAPFMGSWNREKSSRIIDGVRDLIRRKNPNHPNYQAAASSISGILYTIRPPTIWCRYPPQAHLLNL